MTHQPPTDDNSKYLRYLVYLIVGTAIFRLLYINALNLAPQEAYYWNYSRHLALSYLDHPPMLAYMIYLFTGIGGQSEFFVRLGCVLLASGLTYVVYLTAKTLFDARVGFFSAVLLNSVLVFFVGSMIATPDTPMMFFWGLSLLLFSKLVVTQEKKWWYLLGIGTGLALLSKYTAVFIILSVFLFLVFSKENRRWLLTKEPYLALVSAMMVFSPVIIWNAKNHWASFLFQSSRRVGELGSFSASNFFGYLGAQIGVVSPLLFGGLLYAVVKSGILGFREKNQRFLLCFFWSFPLVGFFTLVATHYWVKMNWITAAYLPASIAAVALYFEFQSRGRTWIRTYGILALIVSLIFVLVALILPVVKSIPVSSSLDTISGWRQLAQRVEKERAGMPEGTVVIGYEYKVASEIAFYASMETYSNNFVGQNGLEYDYWSDPNDFVGRDAVFVYDDQNRYRDPESLSRFFDSVAETEPLEIYRAGRRLTTFHLFRCYGYRGPVAASGSGNQ
jgi:4-amino-4-deoxy-L-arabinose transferase-like glycosyltransferase